MYPVSPRSPTAPCGPSGPRGPVMSGHRAGAWATAGLAFALPQHAQPLMVASAAIAHNASTTFISDSFLYVGDIDYTCSAAYAGRVTLVRFVSSSIYAVHLISGARHNAWSRPTGRTAPPRAAAFVWFFTHFRGTPRVFRRCGPRQNAHSFRGLRIRCSATGDRSLRRSLPNRA